MNLDFWREFKLYFVLTFPSASVFDRWSLFLHSAFEQQINIYLFYNFYIYTVIWSGWTLKNLQMYINLPESSVLLQWPTFP